MSSVQGERLLGTLTKVIEQQLPASCAAKLYYCSFKEGSVGLLWSSGEDFADELLVKACQKRQRTVQIHDAEKHSLFRGTQPPPYGSALCLPLFDDSKFLIGFLSLVCDKTEVFSKQDRYSWERVARDAGETLARVREHEQPVPAEEPSGYAFLYHPVTPVIAISLLLGLGLWFMAPSDPGPVPEPSAIPETTYQPQAIAREFLQDLREEKPAEAWQLFTPELQARWPQAEFEAELSAWLRTGNNQKILETRHLYQVRRTGEQAVALFNPTGVAGDQARWTWTLKQRRGEDWRLSTIEGGPVTSPSN